ncbi:aminoglycoside phosphotransferase family protein [Nocardioides coralli]|uniref:aminoglycoside phosphotransferase family protein n=1 Tax=Nocardioides coralli TaxID=2872154 RepID=UPI001CA3B223|nr:aminoglycoside phosphotransferase family protein [Nocardioides coralli]QZY28914.1 aminoglycoside phosphotransferase family protein [Nocardioides coralli]
MSAVQQVALAHEGKVLVTDAGLLPEQELGEDDSDDGYRLALELVGADVFLAPVVRLAARRYLAVVGCRALPLPPGRWVPLAELSGQVGEVGEVVARCVREHEVDPPALRPAWFRPGWYDAVEAWVDAALDRAGRRRTGVMRLVRTWSLSTVLRIPTSDGELWFKAPCDLFRAEGAIHRAIGRHFPDDVPVLVAVDEERGWLLMEEMGGATEGSRAEGAGPALATRWAEVQIASLRMLDDLRAAGGLVRDAEVMVRDFRTVLDAATDLPGLAPDELVAILDVADEAAAMVRELWACGIPDTLAHGDLHVGNVAWDGTALRVYDLTDACISHPFLDGCHLALFDDRHPPDHELIDAFVAPWRAAFPHARVDDAIRLAPVADLVFQADTFDRIRRATEPASAYELGTLLPWLLGRLPAAVAAARRT